MIKNILEFGAVADGKTINTQSIQSAIDCVAEAGGGRVVVPGGLFISGTIWLKSNVELHILPGGTLKASDNFADYNDEDAYPQNWGYPPEQWTGRHFIISVGQENELHP